MDTVTHVLLGTACAVAVSRKPVWSNSDFRPRLLVTGIASAFPDIDYLSFWIDPLLFLADWHRTFTHSLLLMPVWAGLIWAVSMLWQSARSQPLVIFTFCCLGILSHICLDLLTVYGVSILYPVSDRQFSIGIVFVIDGIVTATLAAALFFAFRRSWRHYTTLALSLLLIYFGGLWMLKHQAINVASEQLRGRYEQFALPQPFSPFYWQLIGQSGADYRVAHLNLLAGDKSLINAYRGPRSLEWQAQGLLGSQDEWNSTVKQVWDHQKFNKFREFARFPVLYRLHRDEQEECVWFTDLRYVLPYLIPSFRYGMCRALGKPWRLSRLKRFTVNERHVLD